MDILKALNELTEQLMKKQAQEVPDSNAASKSDHPTEKMQDPNVSTPPAEGQHGKGESQVLKNSIPQGVDNTQNRDVSAGTKPLETNKTIPAEPTKEQTPPVSNPEPQTTAQTAATGDLGAISNSDHPTNEIKSADINKLAEEIISALNKENVNEGGEQMQTKQAELSKDAEELIDYMVKQAEQDAELYVNYIKGWLEGLKKEADDAAAEDIIKNIPPEDIVNVLAEEIDKLSPEEAEQVLQDLIENGIISPEEVEEAADLIGAGEEEEGETATEEEEPEATEEGTEQTPSEEEVQALSEAIPEEVAKAAAALDELGVPAEEIDRFLEKNSKEYAKIKNREKIASILSKAMSRKKK